MPQTSTEPEPWTAAQHSVYLLLTKEGQKGISAWIDFYVAALLARDLDTCARLSTEPFPFPPVFAALVATHFAPGTVALREHRQSDALQSLSLGSEEGVQILRAIFESLDGESQVQKAPTFEL